MAGLVFSDKLLLGTHVSLALRCQLRPTGDHKLGKGFRNNLNDYYVSFSGIDAVNSTVICIGRVLMVPVRQCSSRMRREVLLSDIIRYDTKNI